MSVIASIIDSPDGTWPLRSLAPQGDGERDQCRERRDDQPELDPQEQVVELTAR